MSACDGGEDGDQPLHQLAVVGAVAGVGVVGGGDLVVGNRGQLGPDGLVVAARLAAAVDGVLAGLVVGVVGVPAVVLVHEAVERQLEVVHDAAWKGRNGIREENQALQ